VQPNVTITAAAMPDAKRLRVSSMER
jgi:hypothetical protein